ncbi:Hypothetical predicted protein [Cloeon dipterum]|uniref:RNA-directed DNA polymerase n=1 Tax=Cloeon dipterum TaxID=197152 RepID=A0A8S1E773_9INSE|nr:Hypothetical predicted protein [Cloeon dipterum]
MFILRTLKNAERNYSQVEIEALAVVWAVKKFRQFLWGRKFTLITDHKPLIGIFGEGKGVNEDLPTKLKRLPLPDEDGEEEELEVADCKIAFLECFQHDDIMSLAQLKQETEKDPKMSQLKTLILQGRAAVPGSLRAAALKALHLVHFGMAKMKALARSYFWWPGMDKDIEEMARSCEPCLLVNKSPNKALVIPWSIPHRPWSRIHLDFFELKRGESFMIVADGLSGYMDVEKTKGLDAKEASRVCRKLFRTHGLCDVIVADNGPAFRSEEFQEFCKNNGIEIIYSPPYSPASNGVAERAVQTAKQFLKKTENLKWLAKLDSFILGHNATPNPRTGVAPAEFNLGRRPQTVLDKLHPSAVAMRKKVERDRKAAAAVARLPKIEKDQRVVFRNFHPRGPKWQAGRVKKILGPRRVMIEEDKNKVVLERHTDQVKPVGKGHINRPVETREVLDSNLTSPAARPSRIRKPPDRLRF